MTGLWLGATVLPAQNLLTNGNFEASTFAASGKTLRTYQEFGRTVTSWYVMNELPSGITGWTYTAGSATDELHLSQTNLSTTAFVSLGNSSSDAGGALSQNFTAVIGATYTASLDVALYGLGPVNGPAIKFGIYSGSTLVASATFNAGDGTLTNSFVTRTIKFVAPAANLTFKVWDVTAAGTGGNWGVACDNATVTGAAIPTDGLVLFYPFNGNTDDAGPLQNHGGVVGTRPYTFDRNGTANAAYQIIDSYVVSKAKIGVAGNADRSVSLWFYLDAQPTAPGGNLCSWGTTSGVGNLFSVVYEPWQEQGYKFSINCGYLKRGFLAASNPETGRWHHLVCTYTTRLDMARMFLNGVELVGVADPRWGGANATINTVDSQVYVGALLNEWWGIRGAIDDVRIYNRTLSAAEAIALNSSQSVYPPTAAELAAQLAILQQKLKDTDDLVASLQTQLAAANNTINQLRGDKTALEQQIAALNTQLNAKNDQIAQLQSEKASLQTQLNTANSQLTASNARADRFQSENSALQQQVTTLTAQLSTANALNVQLQADKDTLNRQLSAKTTELNNSVSQIAQLESDKSVLQQQLEAARAQLATATSQIARLTTANEALQQQTDSLTAQLSSANSKIRELTADKLAIQQDLDSTRTRLATANATVAQLQTANAGLQQQLTAKEALLATANAKNAQLMAEKLFLETQLATVSEKLSAANALVIQLQSANATLQQQLNTATTSIAALTGQVNQLTAAVALLTTQQIQGLAGMDEIMRLIQLPAGRRTSTLRFTGPEGVKANAIIDALLAPPGQNVAPKK